MAEDEWLPNHAGDWFGREAKRRRVESAPAAPSQPAATPIEPEYCVLYLPLRCPNCRLVEAISTYSVRLDQSPPTRYHRCERCNFRFKSIEVNPDGTVGR
jgi:DNA-directed RNA polymerase subunit M/transcription elongation factor TFIIS